MDTATDTMRYHLRRIAVDFIILAALGAMLEVRAGLATALGHSGDTHRDLAAGIRSRGRFPSTVTRACSAAPIIAVEAHDHYFKVHTDAGCEMITARLADALGELIGVWGFRTHRSWWVAGNKIEAAAWSRGVGAAKLAGGLVAPVSRKQAAILREAGC